RAELRFARRQALRAKGASVLVMALVALPMVGLSAGLVVWASHQPTLAQEVTLELGEAQSRFEIVSGADPSLRQSPGDPWYWEIDRDPATGEPTNPVEAPLADPLSLVPRGTEIIEIGTGRAVARTPGGVGAFSAVVGDAWDPALAGRYELLAGRAPTGPDEGMVSPGALARLGAEIGDRVELTRPAASFTISGILKAAEETDSAPAVFLPAVDLDVERRTWYAPDWQPAAAELPSLNTQGVIAFARDLMLARDERYIDPGTAWAIASVTAIVAAFAGYLVVLLAGAAFSVSARRQQHSLAVAASVGAPPESLRRVVVLQGTVLGLIGGLTGAALGIGLAYPVLALIDDGRVQSFWGFHVPWWGILGIVAFAVAVGTAAAYFPARAATRGDVLLALRGSRRPVSLRTDRPLWGTLLMAVGIASTAAAGIYLAALTTANDVDYDNPWRNVAVWVIVAGPILFQVGVILAGHWVLTLFARIFSRGGLAVRLASRDAAANPGRVVPAFGAIAACVFLAAFALTAVSLFSASTARNYWWQAPEGSVAVTVWSSSSDASPVGVRRVEDSAVDAVAETGPAATAVVRGEPDVSAFVDGVPTDERLATVFRAEVFGAVACDDPDAVGLCLSEWSRVFGWEGQPLVIAPDDLATALGTTIPDDAMRIFEAGGVIALDNPMTLGTFVSDGEATLREWDGSMLAQDEFVSDGDGPGEPLRTLTLPAVTVDTPHSLPWHVIVSPDAADALGMKTTVRTIVADYDGPIDPVTLDRLTQLQELSSSPDGGFSIHVENGPPDPAPWLWFILGAVGALVLGAGGVALGLAGVERRPDDATLTAVGATPLLRRGIAFWQTIVIVGLGVASGTIAGLIPMWGIAFALNTSGLDFADVPWLWLGLLAVGLPLAIAVFAWLVPPRHPDLTRRTAIA
ncbi:MAG: FtsX-like permease family protein, partial [Microbacterium sp.]